MSGFGDPEYAGIRAGCQASADVIVPILAKRYSPGTVLDVGCGEGWFGGRFAAFGASVVGIDFARPSVCAIDAFVEWDLSRPDPFPPTLTGDLVICLETAEHLPPDRAEGLVSELIAAGPTIAFSAAVPGQGGHRHINERWASYWAGLFAERSYEADLSVRGEIWDDARVEPWYRQNLIVFQETSTRPIVIPPMIDVVHPKIFGWRVHDAGYWRGEWGKAQRGGPPF